MQRQICFIWIFDVNTFHENAMKTLSFFPLDIFQPTLGKLIMSTCFSAILFLKQLKIICFSKALDNIFFVVLRLAEYLHKESLEAKCSGWRMKSFLLLFLSSNYTTRELLLICCLVEVPEKFSVPPLKRCHLHSPHPLSVIVFPSQCGKAISLIALSCFFSFSPFSNSTRVFNEPFYPKKSNFEAKSFAMKIVYYVEGEKKTLVDLSSQSVAESLAVI